MLSLVAVYASAAAQACAQPGAISTDQWQAIVAAGLLLMNALAGYLVWRSHDGGSKP